MRGRDIRRGGRRAAHVADLRAMGWRGALGREQAPDVDTRRIRPGFPDAVGFRRRPVQGDGLLRPAP
ncbi:hypothetical protein G6F58_013760 [Rhizopus delemar]|nr:hypothetical protein G6F58_013760 [Rhizopus delemar]